MLGAAVSVVSVIMGSAVSLMDQRAPYYSPEYTSASRNRFISNQTKVIPA